MQYYENQLLMLVLLKWGLQCINILKSIVYIYPTDSNNFKTRYPSEMFRLSGVWGYC